MRSLIPPLCSSKAADEPTIVFLSRNEVSNEKQTECQSGTFTVTVKIIPSSTAREQISPYGALISLQPVTNLEAKINIFRVSDQNFC